MLFEVSHGLKNTKNKIKLHDFFAAAQYNWIHLTGLALTSAQATPEHALWCVALIIKMTTGSSRLSEQTRLEIIDKASAPAPPSNRALARQYKISEAAVRKLLKNKQAVIDRTRNKAAAQLATTRRYVAPNHPQLEADLHDWLVRLRGLKIEVTPSLVQVKALELAGRQNPPITGFLASYG